MTGASTRLILFLILLLDVGGGRSDIGAGIGLSNAAASLAAPSLHAQQEDGADSSTAFILSNKNNSDSTSTNLEADTVSACSHGQGENNDCLTSPPTSAVENNKNDVVDENENSSQSSSVRPTQTTISSSLSEVIIPSVPPEIDNIIETGYGPGQNVFQLVVSSSDDTTSITTTSSDQIRQVIQQMHEYMYGIIYHPNYPHPTIRHQCQNKDANCSYWSARGECITNPDYMHYQCAPSCRTCDKLLEKIILGQQDNAASTTTTITNDTIDIGYGVPQLLVDTYEESIQTLATQMVEYMTQVVYQDNFSHPEIRDQCTNKDKYCLYWSLQNECKDRPSYMYSNCAPACLACEYISFAYRCRDYLFPPNSTIMIHENSIIDETQSIPTSPDNIWKPGDLYTMFERIVLEYNHSVTILLRPSQGHDDDHEYDTIQSAATITTTDIHYTESSMVDEIAKVVGDKQVHGEEEQPPWIITIDDFLTPEECDRLIELGGQQGYAVSEDVGELNADGSYGGIKHEGRTSTNAWCIEECYNDTITQQVIHKMEQLTGIPDANAEYIQLLKYETKQFYQSHHDYIEHHAYRAQGVRIMTLFLYLNDVTDGGGTRFTQWNLTVVPKRGRALLWPSVYNDDPDRKDPSTEHEALPVLEGIKYGANAWFHQRDFKAPYVYNCI